MIINKQLFCSKQVIGILSLKIPDFIDLRWANNLSLCNFCWILDKALRSYHIIHIKNVLALQLVEAIEVANN